MILTLPEQYQVISKIEQVTTVRMGGMATEAYNNELLKLKVYIDIFEQISNKFKVKSFKGIDSIELVELLDFLESYQVPLALSEEIIKCNMSI